MDITGSTAIVTGGASGIGAAAARQLAARGATVVIADLQADKGEALAEEIKGVFAQVDVTNTDQIKAAVDAATAIAPLRAVVNSAGIGWAQRTIGRDGEFDSAHDLEAYRKVIAINLIGTFDMTRLAATAMSRNEPDADGCRGAIANLTSVAAFDGQVAVYLHRRASDLPPAVGVLVEYTGDDLDAARGAAMQIAAMRPRYLTREDVPADIVAKEREIAEATAREEGKPEQAIAKITEGRVNGFFKDVVLLDQPSVTDNKKTVKAVLDGAGVDVKRFAHIEIGA